MFLATHFIAQSHPSSTESTDTIEPPPQSYTVVKTVGASCSLQASNHQQSNGPHLHSVLGKYYIGTLYRYMSRSVTSEIYTLSLVTCAGRPRPPDLEQEPINIVTLVHCVYNYVHIFGHFSIVQAKLYTCYNNYVISMQT